MIDTFDRRARRQHSSLFLPRATLHANPFSFDMVDVRIEHGYVDNYYDTYRPARGAKILISRMAAAFVGFHKDRRSRFDVSFPEGWFRIEGIRKSEAWGTYTCTVELTIDDIIFSL